jgi:hypothetical protein
VERKERKKVVPQTIENVKILVNINRAVYVPRRVATRYVEEKAGVNVCYCTLFGLDGVFFIM